MKHPGRNMAAKKKAATRKTADKPRRRWGWRIALAIACLVALGAGAMHVNANIVRVRYAEVALEDLPTGFDGKTILFASDFDLCGLNTAGNMRRLFGRLQDLHPDVLLLGGDYASASILDRLNGKTGADEMTARRDFFKAVADFSAPMGKYAVSGDNDGNSDQLNLSMMNSGVSLIDGKLQAIHSGADTIVLAGIGESTPNLSALSGQLTTDQCVIALMHRPSRAVDVRIAEARNSGPWADLILAGHTHGGQIRIGNRTLLSLSESEKRNIGGWSTDGGAMLVTQGVGCEGANLRFGSRAEVWLITLKCK